MCKNERIERRQPGATTTVRGRLPLIPVGVMAVDRSSARYRDLWDLRRTPGRIRLSFLGSSRVSRPHLVALSCDQALIWRSRRVSYSPESVGPPTRTAPTRSPLKLACAPIYLCGSLSRSGLRFQTPTEPKHSRRSSVHHPHYALMTHPLLGRRATPILSSDTVCQLSRSSFVAIMQCGSSRRPLSSPTQLATHSTFFLRTFNNLPLNAGR